MKCCRCQAPIDAGYLCAACQAILYFDWETRYIRIRKGSDPRDRKAQWRGQRRTGGVWRDV